MRVLLVDDDPSIREVLAEGFRLHNLDVAVAGDAEAGCCMVPYVDAVVCDGLDGGWRRVCTVALNFGKRAVVYSGDWDALDGAKRLGIPVVNKPGGGLVELFLALELGATCVPS